MNDEQTRQGWVSGPGWDDAVHETETQICSHRMCCCYLSIVAGKKKAKLALNPGRKTIVVFSPCQTSWTSVVEVYTQQQQPPQPYGRAWTVLIWNVAPGRSDVSACTVVLMPRSASAPRIIPQGNHRYWAHMVSLNFTPLG